MKVYRRLVCLDFDGVVHLFDGEWKGKTAINGPAVAGALQFIVESLLTVDIAIYSARSSSFFGRRAMKNWLITQLYKQGRLHDHCPEYLKKRVYEHAFADPWEDEVMFTCKRLANDVKWPRSKPAAGVHIDDRAINFDGDFPALSTLTSFQPWWKKVPPPAY